MNNKIIKSIVDIQRRKSQYVDILDRRVHGQNIYHLQGNSREQIYSKTALQAKQESGGGAVMPDKNQKKAEKISSSMKTIPNSNLNQRKHEVLRIHKENMRMVKKLAVMKAH